MPVILTIGYRRFLMKSQAQASAVLGALMVAVPIKRDYDQEAHQEIFTPEDEEKDVTLAIEVVKADQIRRHVRVVSAEARTVPKARRVQASAPAPLMLKFGEPR